MKRKVNYLAIFALITAIFCLSSCGAGDIDDSPVCSDQYEKTYEELIPANSFDPIFKKPRGKGI